ncbi:MAG: sigma-54-dependent Fis family transcriptional regulator [Bacillota bacterium]
METKRIGGIHMNQGLSAHKAADNLAAATDSLARIDAWYLDEYRKLELRVERTKRAWEEFQRTGSVSDETAVPRQVLESWKRCKARGLDPGSRVSFCLSPRELAERRQRNRLLIETATPFLQTLVESISGSGFRVDLFDKDLFLLAQFGDEKTLQEAAARGSAPGVSRSEDCSGTNAINLAAHLMKPVQLVGPEHYAKALHHWTCSATPVFDPQGNFIGVINMAGHYKLMHKHTLGMVIAIGKAIEQSLQQRQLIAALEESNEYLNNVIHAVSDGLLVVDPLGRITTLNRSAARFLGIEPREVLGKPIDSLLGESNPFREVLRTGVRITNQQISLRVKEGHRMFVGSFEPVMSSQGLRGVIGILKHFDDARRFVRDVAGFKAYFTFDDLVGRSHQFKKVVDLARQAAKLPVTILLQGESGTGKELFAQAIHNESAFRNGPFVALNCAAVPRELIESELFGYEEGAFTGAQKGGKPGKFELAEGGTIFLDEVNSMSLDMQAKLMRVLQSKRIVRVGGVREIPINVRLICATNRDLWQQVQEGSFREDLYYRINVFPINIPPLRSRVEDIPILAHHFASKVGQQLGVQLEIPQPALDIMIRYKWPGNVRELENVIERCSILAMSRASCRIEVEDVMTALGLGELKDVAGSHGPNLQRGGALSRAEVEAIMNALRASGGNLSEAARILGVARTTLYRKIKRYNLNKAAKD